MKFFVFIFFILIVQFCFSQQIHWEKTKNWKLYDIHDDNAFRYSIDTLRNFKSLKLDEMAIHDFLKQAVSWPKEKNSLWMGLYVTTCEIQNGETRKIDVSVYGGFFYDEKEKVYYALPPELKEDWLQYFHESAVNLSSH
jgi:hypothetical protein